MKRAALYLRVSTLDQHPETQLYDLRQMAQQRGYQIVEEYTDRISPNNVNTPAPEHSSSVSSKNYAAFFTTSTSASLLFQKPSKYPPAKPTKSMAGSHRSGRSKRCGF